MNWFIKLFARAKEEVKPEETITINFNDLDPWFESKISDKISLVEKEVQLILNSLNSESSNLKAKLETLNKASLQNPNIPIRAKQYMEGNREAYIKSIKQFISSLEINQLEPLNIPYFCTDIKRKLDFLAKSTQRPYTILQEFFAHQSSDIARSLKNILSIIEDLEKLYNKSSLSEINSIKQDIKAIKNKLLQKESTSKLIQNIESEIKSLSETLSKLNSEKQFLTKSESYKKYNELKIEKSQLTNELRNLEQNFIDNFQSLEPALKRFAKISSEEALINDYLTKPIKALLNDIGFKIIAILDNLSKNIQSSSIQLKDKKEKKTLEKIKEFSQEYLKSFIDHYKELSAKNKELNLMIEQNEAEKLLIDLNQRINDISYRLDNKTTHLAAIRKEQEKFDISLVLHNLSNKISLFLKEEMTISL